MYIKSIEVSNFNNYDEPRKINFSKGLNYLYGANGTGKSTLLYAIQYALLGYIPAFGKTKETTFEHSANGANITVELIVTDGKTDYTIHRELNRTPKGKLDEKFEVTPYMDLQAILGLLELPILKYDEFCSLTANKLKDWFTEFLPATQTEIEWKKEIKKEIKDCSDEWLEEVLAEVTGKANLAQNPLDLVRLVNAYAKDCVSVENAQIKRLSSTTQSLVFFDDIPYSDDTIESTKEKIDAISKRIYGYSDYAKYNATIDTLDAKYNYKVNANSELELSAEIASCNEELKNIKSEMDKIDAIIRDIDVKRRSAEEIYKFICDTLDGGTPVCHISGASCSALSSSTLIAKGRTLENELNGYESKLKEMTERLNVLQEKYSDTYSKVQNLTEIKSNVISLPSIENLADYDLFDLDEAEEEKASLEKILEQMYGNAKYTELYDKIEAEIFTANQRLEWFKKLSKLTDVNGLQTVLTNKPFIDLECRLDSSVKLLFGNDYSAKILVSDKSNGFCIGIVKDAIFVEYQYLSSGEKCLFSLALLSTFIKDTDKNLLCVVLADDMLDHLDTVKADRAFNALNEMGIQYVLAGVKPCGVEECVIHI